MKSLLVTSIFLAGCTSNGILDTAMSSAKVPAPHASMRVGDRMVLAGDLHCHVLPPDSPWHVSRELPETLKLAEEQHLDFVLLTPHVRARFFQDPDEREWVAETQTELRARIESLRPTMIVIPGFEYTDHRYGHVGMGFADVREVMKEVDVTESRTNPTKFLESWLAHGGTMVINHPLQGPIKNSVIEPLRWDLTWRGYGAKPVPEDDVWLTEHAQAVETFNAAITHLRDQFILGDEERTLREASALVDRQIKKQHRAIAQVGGSDSHGQWLRPTTYVLVKERSVSAIHDAIVEGRTCVRSPESCSLEVSGDDGVWHGIGEHVTAAHSIRLRLATPGIFVLDGARPAEGIAAELPVSADHCSIARAISGLSWSSGIYVNCP